MPAPALQNSPQLWKYSYKEERFISQNLTDNPMNSITNDQQLLTKIILPI